MRKIIFLDFDGVLHPDGIGLFSQLGVFEECVLRMKDVEIVISSSWRETDTLDQLRSHFTHLLQERIVGITPSLDDGYDSGGRQREIETFLDSAGLNKQNCFWIALDDTQLFFDDDYPNLLLTDASQGFTASDSQSLLE